MRILNLIEPRERRRVGSEFQKAQDRSTVLLRDTAEVRISSGSSSILIATVRNEQGAGDKVG